MNRKVIKVSHIYTDSQCCVCGQAGLGQFSNVKENYVNVRGSLVSYISILESTLNYQVPVEENLVLCEACKNTIVPFYLLKIKFHEACQLPSPYEYEESQNTNEKPETLEQLKMQIKQEFDSIDTESYKLPEQSTDVKPETIRKKRSRPERIKWMERKDFATSEEALEFVKSQKIWSVKHTKPISKSGEKRQYFRCNLVPKAQPRQCSSVMALVTKSDGSTIMLQSAQPHDHSQILHNVKSE